MKDHAEDEIDMNVNKFLGTPVTILAWSHAD
jgi:hypothetical protein